SLDQMFFGHLNRILDPIDDAAFDKTRWGNLYRGGLSTLLRTPRDVIRFANSLMVSYPAVRGEVDVIDFVAMEALRVFAPRVHQAIALHPDRFTGHDINGHDAESRKPWHDS